MRVPVSLPVQVPGEDVANAPFGPVSARSHLLIAPPVLHDGWPDARPDWEDLDSREHDAHREDCPGLCAWCENHRAWGDCTSCGREVEVDDCGLSFCCGSPVVNPGPVVDDLRQVAS